MGNVDRNQLIRSLHKPAVYPHAVNNISLLETHISWVILTGSYVYKIKKPVDFGFLNFSSLEKRKFYCEEELRLNRRFSDGLYVDVVSITGTVDHPQINGAGKILDYAVRMTEFPQAQLLSHYIFDPGLAHEQVDALAYQLVQFHQMAARSIENSGGTPSYGSFEAVAQPMIENSEQIRPCLSLPADSKKMELLSNWVSDELASLAEVIEGRRRAGFVRECHGDLHLGNIAIIDGEITFFDCIEFNDQLRWIDTFSELAYLIMDLDKCNKKAFANRLLNQYLDYSGDYTGLKLLRLYKVYRAMVKAKVTLLQSPQTTALSENYYHYIRLASSYIVDHKPFIAITYGVAASGKSTVSEFIAAHCHAVRLRSDVERKRLFGLTPLERSTPELKPQMYSEQASEKTFTALRQLTTAILESDYAVIIDATFLRKQQREKFRRLAMDCAVPFVIVDCQSSETVLLDRLAKRQGVSNEVSEADVEIMQQQRLHRDVLSDCEKKYRCVVNTEQPLSKDADWLSRFESLRGINQPDSAVVN